MPSQPESPSSAAGGHPAQRVSWRPILILEAANGLSGTANAIVMLSIPWLVLELTGSPAMAGVVAAVSSVPGALASPLAGWAVDRLGRRRVSIASDIFSAISVAGIPVIGMLGWLAFWPVLGLAVLGAVFDPAGYTARKALIPDVAAASRMPVDRLNGIHEGVFAAGWTLGPLLAAVLIASIGVVDSFWVPFALCLGAALLIAMLRVGDAGQEARAAAEAEGRTESGWRAASRGLAIIWRDRPLRALTIAIMVLAAVYLPTESVILPTFYEGLAQPASLGFVIAALAFGSIVGAFSYGWLTARMSRYTLARVALLGTMVGIVIMATLPPLPVMIAGALFLGLAWGPMNPLLTTIVQRRVPPEAQGRVFGVQLSVFYAAPPLAMLATGFAITGFGLQPTYLAIAGLLVVTGLATLLVRSIRGIND